MSLIHALVARGDVILAEHSSDQRDFSQAIQKILSKIPPNNSKLTYVWQQFLFHYVSEGGFIFMVMADDSVGRRTPFGFLAELQRRFSALPTPSTSSSDQLYHDHAMQQQFGPQIASLLEEYNTTPPTDALHAAQADLNQVKDIMVHNVEQILSRGERIELLVDKTDNMAGQAHAFRRGARTVRRQQFWKNQKIMIIGVGVGILIIYLLVAQVCGLALQCAR